MYLFVLKRLSALNDILNVYKYIYLIQYYIYLMQY